MEKPSSVRLGGVRVTYNPKTGICIQDVHDASIELVIYEPDIPALLEFVEAARRTGRPPEPHWVSSANPIRSDTPNP